MRESSVIVRVAVIVGALVAAVLMPWTAPPDRAEAVTAADWDAGYIISDARFFDSGAMTEAQVQSFLAARLPSCAAANGQPCLRDYRATTFSRAAVEPGHCTGYVGAENEPASRIIVKAAQACRINPQVLLVMLQKEQGLVTAGSPTERQYRVAMGYGCPDTADCDSAYFGFYNQVYHAARQLRQYTNYPQRTYRIGSVPIQYHPNTGCGSSVVAIRNQATANLYNYTPYQPNAAALANLRGVGDGCSAYGNRNFWVTFHDWFGDPRGGGRDPIGNIELVSAGPGTVRVAGWALDPDTSDSIAVHIYVGPNGSAHTASLQRSDVGAAYGLGSAHGFDATIPVTASGTQDVCVYAINAGSGANALLACTKVDLLAGPPVGSVDPLAVGDGTVTVSGWALDPDRTGPIEVHVYVGSSSVAVQADRPVALDAKYAVYGDAHGFRTTVTAAPGTNRVCVYAMNVGAGSNVELACRTVEVIGELGRPPTGNAEVIAAENGSIRVAGWALDPDTTRSIAVHVYVGSNGRAITADRSRTDIAAAYPGYGAAHGFTELITVTPGTYDVCAYAINTGAGGHTLLRCSSVRVGESLSELGRVPVGVLEDVRVEGGSVAFTGWALDPDTASPIDVHLYVGTSATAIRADLERADVGQANPSHGPNHGFRGSVAVAPGSYTACAYAINSGPGGPAQLGCRAVTVPSTTAPATDLGRAPVGNLELVAAGSRSVRAAGWTIDPDTAASTAVHVYVGSTGFATIANRERADVAAAYPGYGSAHGFDYTAEAPPGPQQVCVYAINTGAGGHTLIACRAVDVPG